MAEIEGSCPCGCTQPAAAGCSYAGGTERERETHRARANRQREAADRRRQAREAEAQGVLAEIGLDPEAPAHRLAQALDELAGRVQRLAVIVGLDLKACDLDQQREHELALRAEHHASLQAIQSRLDESSLLRRGAERHRLEAEAATRQAELEAAQANADRDAALGARDEADRALQASRAQAEEDVARAGSAMQAAEQLLLQLAAAETARIGAEAAQADAEDMLRRALSDLREQQLRTAEVLAEQERRSSDTLTSALATADRRAVRDRRAAVREVRDSLLRDRDQLRAELAVARREQGGQQPAPADRAG